MEEKLKKLQEILSSNALASKVESSEDIPAVLQLLADNGLNLTADELGQMLESITKSNGELSEDDLANVAGGVYLLGFPRVISQMLLLWKRYRFR